MGVRAAGEIISNVQLSCDPQSEHTDPNTALVTTTIPDSINKSPDSNSCFMRKNFINIMKLCL